MGLDAIAYSKMTQVENPERDDGGELIDYDTSVEICPGMFSWGEDNWPGRTEGLTSGTVYSFENSDSLYTSYGGHYRFRKWLAVAAGHTSAEDIWEAKPLGPFVELIDFADNEGFLGPVVCAKLAKDFAEHQDAILDKTTDENMSDRYKEWRKMFDLAADGGCVEFS